MSRCAAVFAFTAHGLARELHQNNAFKQKALQLSQRAYQQPIASERAMAARPQRWMKIGVTAIGSYVRGKHSRLSWIGP